MCTTYTIYAAITNIMTSQKYLYADLSRTHRIFGIAHCMLECRIQISKLYGNTIWYQNHIAIHDINVLNNTNWFYVLT